MVNWLPLMARTRLPRPPRVVVTLHEPAGPLAGKLPAAVRRAWLLPLLLFSDAVIVTNERDLALLGRLPLLRRRARLIRLSTPIEPSTDPAFDRIAARRRLGVLAGETLLVRFGFLHNPRWSGLPLMLEAVQRLAGQGQPVKLLLAGDADPKTESQIRSLAEHLGIRDRVLIAGYCVPSRISELLRCADLGMQFYPEGVSERRSSLLTVLAHRLPVIARAGKSPSSLFHHNENVWLIQDLTSESIAAAVAGLMTDRPIRDRLAKNAEALLSHFQWPAIAEETTRLYGSLLPGNAQ